MAFPLLTQSRAAPNSALHKEKPPTLSTKLMFCLPSQFRSQSRLMSARKGRRVSHYGLPRSPAQACGHHLLALISSGAGQVEVISKKTLPRGGDIGSLPPWAGKRGLGEEAGSEQRPRSNAAPSRKPSLNPPCLMSGAHPALSPGCPGHSWSVRSCLTALGWHSEPGPECQTHMDVNQTPGAYWLWGLPELQLHLTLAKSQPSSRLLNVSP